MENRSFYLEEEFTGDYSEISELFLTDNKANDAICNPVYLEWQYSENPHGQAIISCARENETNKLVGVYIVNPVELWLHGKTQKAALSLNTFTHQDHRGKGMFTELARTCYELSRKNDVKYIIGFPNEMSYGGFVKKLGFMDMGMVSYLFKPINYLNLVRDVLFKSKSPSGLSVLQSKSYEQIEELNVGSLNQLDFFFSRHRENCLFQTSRTMAHYRWRFFENPLNNYKIFINKDTDKKILSVLVLRIVSGVTNDIQIVDFCCLDKESGTEIIKFLLKEGKSKFTFARVFAQVETIEYKVLSSLGFVPKDKLTRKKNFLPFIFKNLEENDIVIPFHKWHISMMDSDVV